MFIHRYYQPIAPWRLIALRTLLVLLMALGALLVLACNPLADDDISANSEEVLDVNFDRASEDNSLNGQQPATAPATEQPTGETSEQHQESPGETTPAPPASESPESSATSLEQDSSMELGAEEALDLVWAFLSQCVSLDVSELEADQINSQWFIQAAGENPDRYGIWKVDSATGSIQPHNIRARQWEPRINSTCTQEAFAEFYLPTPSAQTASTVTEAGQAVTSLWATLVKCYPAMSAEDLQATMNPARSEWIVAAKPEITTNYGVWAVRGSGEVLPYNRQAQGIHDQLDSGLC